MGCSHNCSSCAAGCAESLIAEPHKLSRIGRVIGVASGKGGVGKSLVTSALAVLSRRRGHGTAILDADITGPSIPRAFGVHEHARGNEDGMFPARTESGISMMSVNMLTNDETAPVVWRGPVIAGAVKQFWTDVIWDDAERMFIDMPPGTGDVPLTVFQSIPVDGVVVVATPQELVGMIVEKAVKMLRLMSVPIVALVENMSFIRCPDCGKELYPFGPSRVEAEAKRLGIGTFARMPIDPALAAACDGGRIEGLDNSALSGLSGIMDAIDALN